MYRIIFTMVLSICGSLAFAEGSKQTINMGISFSIPPWVIQSENSGIELDIMRAALDSEKYAIMPHYLPFALAYKRFDAMQLDGVMNATKGASSHGFLTDPVVTLQNVAISLAKKAYSEDIDVSFLTDKKVVAFQRASQFLGEEFKAMAENNESYQEVANQNLQLNLLFIREVDFIVMDISIFGYFWHETVTKNSNDLSRIQLEKFKQEVRFHPLFAPSPYPFIFKDKAVRDDFNRGLRRLRLSGKYREIVERYSHLKGLYTRD